MATLRFALLALLLPFVSAWNAFQANSVAQGQSVLTTNFRSQAQVNQSVANTELFTPLENLSVLSDDTFTTMSHPMFPNYNVRIKRSHFCDSTVNSYTGYIDIEARHLFFYFFESRSDPTKDDVIFWTNGGPGCSSSLGLFMELGPCRVLDENGPKFHKESWNTNANVFFIDQPIGVGYSYADHGETVDTSEAAAKDIAAFVAIFFEHFTQFKGRGFHMAGESYGGRYLPLFASAVYDQNVKLVEAGLTPVNLQSVMIGNGLTDVRHAVLSYYDMACTPASVAPVLDIERCVSMKKTLKRCDQWLKASCHDEYDAINCGAAYGFCRGVFGTPYEASGMNPYDISKKCEGVLEETLCYPITRHITDYLSKPSTWASLGVDTAAHKNFTSCNMKVHEQFETTQDILHRTRDYVGALLERDVRVLIYVGSYDWICNHVGNERWTLELGWSGKEEFSNQPLRDWLSNGNVAGRTRSAQGLTFATIYGAGHMVPYDKPVESLDLLQHWLAKEDL